jgi:hypothetical protein
VKPNRIIPLTAIIALVPALERQIRPMSIILSLYDAVGTGLSSRPALYAGAEVAAIG